MADTRLFNELSKEEKEVLVEDLKALKLTCCPANMTVDELEKLISDARNTETASNEDETQDNTNIAKSENVEPVNSVVANMTTEETKVGEQTTEPNVEKNAQQKTKYKKVERGAFNGICMSCREKVFGNVCSGCGRKY